MPTDCSEKLNPQRVNREGVSQAQRPQEPLKPAFVQVDEHRPADWMVFAKRYAEYVHFFGENNVADGDWRAFFESDPSVLLAVAAVQEVDFYKSKIQQYFKFLLDSDNQANDAGLKLHFGHLFNCAGSLAWQLEQLKEILPKEIALKGVLQNLIRLQLAPAFARLIRYYEAAVADGLVDTDSTYEWDILGAPIGQFQVVSQNNFSADWITNPKFSDWAGFRTSLTADDSIFGGVLMTTVFEKLNHAAGHNLFTGIFDLLVKTYARTVFEAEKSLEKSLTENNAHEPHYTLFLAFLRLLEFARNHANSLTGRHLDFYYKEVLQLKEKPAEPNHAHIIHELAKHVESHLLKKATPYKAGKDSTAKDVTYTLDEDFVPNVAKVTSLKSVYHTLPGAGPRLYAYPIANSADGNGAELTSPDQQWPPYRGLTETVNLAQVGFAIASHYLLLGEGHRKIRLDLRFQEAPAEIVTQADFIKAFDFYFTGEKGWVKAVIDGSLDKLGVRLTTAVTVPLLLDGSQPPIVALKADVHGAGLPEGLPVVRAVLNQEKAGGAARFANLQTLRLDPAASEVAVAVGYDSFSSGQPSANGGLKNLHIFTQSGEVKPDKPFQPFGAVPEKGNFFIVGSDEVFQKKGAKFQFQVKWKGMLDWIGNMDFDWVNAFYPNVKFECLGNGNWNVPDFGAFTPSPNFPSPLNDDTGEVQVFFGTLEKTYFPAAKASLKPACVAGTHFDKKTYATDSRNGFLKISLLGDFGHRLYQLTLTRYLMRVANNPDYTDTSKTALANEFYNFDSNGRATPKPNMYDDDFVKIFSKAMPIEPYTPEIESLTLSYTAAVSLSDASTKVYWQTPFGYETPDTQRTSLLLTIQKPQLGTGLSTFSLFSNIDLGQLLTRTVYNLLPQYRDEGEFYIGLTGLKPPQNLSLLFQLAEGSANPTVKKPEKHVQWSYLSGNDWVDFKESEVSDATGQLTRSGIIRLSVPREATAGDTLILPKGSHWIRATVANKSDAVCNIIAVQAQAARVTFDNKNNADDFLAAQLPAGTIAKLRQPDAAVKKVEQPYPAFGGRAREATEKFYTRVSERLRHKNRAISAWDYERLVLEAFPHIYKVKCLNHTHFEPNDNGGSHIYNELAPGHVTFVAIPNLRNHNAIDPLRPYTSLGDLDLIQKFLAKLVSCFVKLHVHNPVFETVRVSFRVKFFPGTDEAFHQKLLQQELVRFLSPWAFEAGQDVSFGGKIYKSSLIDFVEEQPYVDYVTDFQLFHPKNGQDGTDLEEVAASTAISILVSAAANEHTVTPIPASETAAQGVECKC